MPSEMYPLFSPVLSSNWGKTWYDFRPRFPKSFNQKHMPVFSNNVDFNWHKRTYSRFCAQDILCHRHKHVKLQVTVMYGGNERTAQFFHRRDGHELSKCFFSRILL